MRLLWLMLGCLALAGPALGQSAYLSGRVLGHDGQALPVAHVEVLRNAPRMPRPALLTVEAAPDGTFRVPLPRPGFFFVRFAGPSHRSLELPVLAEAGEVLQVDVRLAPYAYRDDLDGVHLRVKADTARYGFYRAPLEPRPDGTFAATLSVAADTVAYHLAGLDAEGHAINGTDADRYAYDGAGDYYAVRRVVGGQTTLTFDPRRLVRGAGPPRFAFSDPEGRAARFAAAQSGVLQAVARRTDALRAHVEAGGDPRQFDYDPAADVAALEARAQAEADPFIRQVWQLGALRLVRGPDPAALREVLAQTPPSSPLWATDPGLVIALSLATQDTTLALAYLDRVLAEHPDPDLKPTVLLVLLTEASRRDDDTAAMAYYETLIAEHPESFAARLAESEFGAGRRTRPGQTVPDFAFPAFDDSTHLYTPSAFTEGAVLIDFWAVWCAPCVAEMKYLHAAHEQFAGRGLTILSVSFDASPQDVVDFRAEEWPMPWLHTYVPEARQRALMDQFEIVGIPRALLVGPDGRILAAGQALRRDKLARTLDRLLPPAAGR